MSDDLIGRLRLAAWRNYRRQGEVPSPPPEEQLVDGKWCPGSFEGTVPPEEIQMRSDLQSRCARCPWQSVSRVGDRPMRHRPKRRRD